ncbi:hypothetical protein BH10PLA2_BH10PLA2_39250 [soil metagenome]
MAILIEAINVVLRLQTLRDQYPGGIEAFQEDCPNRSYCADDHLVRVGFLLPEEMEAYGDRLEEQGLQGMLDGKCVDFVIVDQRHGPTAPCEWFEWGRHVDGFQVGWLAGTKPGSVVVPEGWTLEDSLNIDAIEPHDASRDRDGLEFVREGDEMDVFRDPETGKEVYMPKLPAPANAGAVPGEVKVSSLYEPGLSDADALVGRAFEVEHAMFHARETEDTDAGAAIHAELTQVLLPRAEQLLETSDDKAAAHYAHGVVLRVCGMHEDAIDAYNRSLELAPEAVPALLEMTVCLGEINRSNEAEPFARKVVEIDPLSAAGWGNLAMVHIQQGDRRNARLALDQALSIDPDNIQNQEIDKRFEDFFP